MPSQQKAIVIESRGIASLVSNSPVPRLRDDYILVKNVAVAINPTDWQHIDGEGQPGATVGCDYAGIVMDVGPNVTKMFAKGDRVCGFIHGSNGDNHEDGAFAEYVTAKGDLQIPIPNGVSFEEAATLGVGITTVGQALYQSLKLPLPMQPSEHPLLLLIYGGSTATGTLAVQFAKLSNSTVITTCSSQNFPLVKRLGADEAFDYKDSACSSKIREYTADKLKHAMDTISIEASAKTCADALSTAGGTYSALEPIECPRKDVESKSTLAYTATGEALTDYGRPASKEDFEFSVMFWKLAGNLLEQGKLKVHPPSVRPNGLRGILEGLQEMREGKVSGEKLVYKIADTP